jgi:hypothetical protein
LEQLFFTIFPPLGEFFSSPLSALFGRQIKSVLFAWVSSALEPLSLLMVSLAFALIMVFLAFLWPTVSLGLWSLSFFF